jgi:hypothetical protein
VISAVSLTDMGVATTARTQASPYGTRLKDEVPGARSSSSSTVPATLCEHRYARARVHSYAVPLRVATSDNAADRVLSSR